MEFPRATRHEAGATGRPSGAPVPGDAASHQFGGKLRFSPAPQQELQVGGLYDEQTGVDYPGRLLTAEHFLLRSWQASYRVANPEGALSSVKLGAYVNKKSHRMSNRDKPTAVDTPGRRPPFALDVSLPAESDTVGANGRVELSPSEQWQLQAWFDFFRLEQDAQRFIARASNRKLLFSDAVWAGVSLADIGTYFHAGRSFDRGEVRAAVRLDFVTSDAGRPSEFFLANAGTKLERSETNANFSLAGPMTWAAGSRSRAASGASRERPMPWNGIPTDFQARASKWPRSSWETPLSGRSPACRVTSTWNGRPARSASMPADTCAA